MDRRRVLTRLLGCAVGVFLVVIVPGSGGASAGSISEIKATFVPNEFATHYTVDVTGFAPGSSISWTLGLKCVDAGCPDPNGTASQPRPNVDPGCNNNGVGVRAPFRQNFSPGTPPDFVWHHPGAGQDPTGTYHCDHTMEGPHGHQGLITVVVSDSNGYSCIATYKGTNSSTSTSATDGTASTPTCSTPASRATLTSLGCGPGSVVVGQAAVCRVVVVDGGAQPSVPVGSVSFGSDSPGSFSPGACSLAATGVAGHASCAVSYTASAVAAGKHALRAFYGGDLSHASSSGASELVVVSRAPPPRLGKSVTVATVAGRVLVRAPGAGGFVVLSVGETIPVGSLVDATHGTVLLSSARDSHGRVQSAQFWEGQFRVSQRSGRGGFTNLTLTASMSGCAGASSEAGIARRRPRRHLWGSGSGNYGTTGQYSSASVHGTKWLVEDRCGETITRVVKGVVTVNDFVLHRTLLVHAGHSYTAHKRH